MSGTAGTDAGGALKFEIRTIFIALRCWWKIALPLGVLLAAGVGSWIYYSFEPVYRARAWIEIKEQPRKILDAPGEHSARFIENQIQLMTSPYLLARLLQRAEVKSLPELQHSNDPLTALASRLKVLRQGKSEFYTIEFSSKSKEKAAKIVNAVADEYQREFLSYEATNRQHMVDVLLQVTKDKAGAVENAQRIAESEAKLARVEFKDPLFGPGVVTALDPEEAELTQITAVLRKADTEITIGEVALKAMEAQSDETSVPPDIVENILANDGELLSIKQDREALLELKRQYEGVLVESKRASNEKYKGILTKISDLEKQLVDRTEARRAEIPKQLADSFRRHRQTELEMRKAALATAKQLRDAWKSKYETAVKNLPKAPGSTAKLRFALDAYESEFQIHKGLTDMLQAIATNAQLENDRVNIKSPAVVPQTPVEATPYKRIAMFAGAAFCIPFLLSVAWEHFFRRVNSRQQLESTVALKVVGEITALPRRTSRGANTRVTRDLQLFEESVDGLRTYLTLVDKLGGLRVLAVTSAISREGKTSVAAQLAVSIAAATGEPTLLIDADLRSPDIHRVFGVDLAPGLADVLSSELVDEEAIETDFNETLHLMTAGRLTTSPHRLLGSGEFRALVDRLRGIYRYIVIDTPPLLAASEALILARTADSAVLSARRDFSRLDQVTEAYTRLQSAGVSVAGVVLNGIPLRNYAYKYGSYGYRKRAVVSH